MDEVLTIEPFRAEATLYFAPGNSCGGGPQRACSRSIPGEPEAEALMVRGLSSRDPTHRARSGSLKLLKGERSSHGAVSWNRFRSAAHT